MEIQEVADMYKFMKEVGERVKNTLCQVTRSHSQVLPQAQGAKSCAVKGVRGAMCGSGSTIHQLLSSQAGGRGQWRKDVWRG